MSNNNTRWEVDGRKFHFWAVDAARAVHLALLRSRRTGDLMRVTTPSGRMIWIDWSL
jgi:hypothetical protein